MKKTGRSEGENGLNVKITLLKYLEFTIFGSE